MDKRTFNFVSGGPPPPRSYDKGGGFVEISSKNYLKRANIAGVSLNGGTLLLDPRNIYVRDSSWWNYFYK